MLRQNTNNGKMTKTSRDKTRQKLVFRRHLADKLLFAAFFLSLLIFSVVTILVLKEYTGYAIHRVRAGSITHVDLVFETTPNYWNGFYGVSVMAREYDNLQSWVATNAGMDEINLIYPCFEYNITHEIYASTVPSDEIVWGSLESASPNDVDAWINPPSSDPFFSWMSANKTFTARINISLGDNIITNIPATHTKQFNNSNSTLFKLGLLKDSNGNFVYVTEITGFVKGFNNRIYNYQMLVPVRNATPETYYFSTDPYDFCPEGYGEPGGDGLINGYVFDNSTGLVIRNVTISASGRLVQTDSRGFYNITVVAGIHNIIAMKQDFETQIVFNVSVAISQATNQNITLVRYLTKIRYGNVTGYVLDDDTGQPIAGVTVTVSNASYTTDSDGFYNIVVLSTKHHILATKLGYNQFVDNVTVYEDQRTAFNISMSRFKPRTGYGNVTGYVFDNRTGLPLSGVTVNIGNSTYVTASNGYYNLIAPATSQNIVAIKSGYNIYVNNITVIFNNRTTHNISMAVYIAPISSGTIKGYVFDNETGAVLSSATVSIANSTYITNSNGYYSFDVPAVKHNVIAIKTNYNTFLGNVTAIADAVVEYNISMSKAITTVGFGNVTGYVFDNASKSPLSGVIVSIANSTDTTGSDGYYNLVAPATTQNIIAIKTGYNSYASNITIIYNSRIQHNITMTTYVVPIGIGNVFGYVRDERTGLLLSNVTVSIANSSHVTSSNGYYNLSAPAARQYIVGIKTSYITFIGNVTIIRGQSVEYNFNMSREFPSFSYGNVSGFVKDHETGLPIANATVSISNGTYNTESNGYYFLQAPAHSQYIVAVKSGYNSYLSNITVLPDTNIFHNISMTRQMASAGNGTLTGFTFHNSTRQLLAEVVLGIQGRYLITNESGFYNFTLVSGTHNIVALKSGYETYWSNVTIVSNENTEHNISMAPLLLRVGTGNITGIVRDSTTGLRLANAIVSIAGQSFVTNLSGEYNLTVISGTHNIVVFRSGYNTYVGNVSVVTGNVVYYNISMSPYVQPQTGTGSGFGTGTGTGTGVGPGVGTGVGPGVATYVEKPKKTEGVDYWVSHAKLDKRLKKETFAIEILRIHNFRDTPMSIEFEMEGDISKIMEIDKKSASILPDSEEEVAITIFGKEEGIYKGNIHIDGSFNKTIPVNIETYEKERLSVEVLLVDLEINNPTPQKKDMMRYKISLRNMLVDEKYNVSIVEKVVGLNGNVSEIIGEDRVELLTATTLIRNITISERWEKGDYKLILEAEYLGIQSEVTSLFSVVEPMYMYALFGLIPLWQIMLGSVLLGSITFGVIVTRARVEAKKRFHAKVNYGELPKKSSRSLSIGKIAETNNMTYYNMDDFTVHTIIAGSTGGGKTIAAQVMIEECLMKGVAVIVFDPTAQWSGMLQKCTDPVMMSHYGSFSLNKNSARSFNGNIKAVTNAREIIDIKKYIKPGEIQIFAANKLEPSEMDMFVANTVRQVFRMNFQESRELKLVLVYDEVHRLLPKFGGSGQGFIQIERACREFRKWGIGVMLISQVLADFVGQIKANINTEIQMKTRDEGDLERIKTKYGADHIKSLVKSPVGSGMFQNSAYNKGNPYFITFRPILHSTKRLNDEQLESFNKYNKILEDAEYQIEQLENEKVEIFDLKLELKLCYDKLKTTNFNLVDIYLEGLLPRLAKEFAKIGKTPKKRETTLVSEEELTRDLKIAEQEREKYVKETKPKDQKEAAEKVYVFNEEVPPEKAFKLKDGTPIISLSGLLDELNSMGAEVFKYHVNEGRNDFASWVYNVINDSVLGNIVSGLRTKEELVTVLEKKSRGEDLSKNPKYMIKKEGKEERPEKKEEKEKPAAIAHGKAPEKQNKEKVNLVKEEEVTQKKASDVSPTSTVRNEIFCAEVPMQNTFRLPDGKMLKSLNDLLEELKTMDDAIFKSHVNENKNDFANWVRDVMALIDLSQKINKAKDRNELIKILEGYKNEKG